MRIAKAVHATETAARAAVASHTRMATLGAMILCVALVACGGQGARGGKGGPPRAEDEVGCDTMAARAVVETFGQRLKNVDLLASDSLVSAEIRANYGPLVSTHLLDGWLFRPETAPGRETSSPWPERIQIDTIATAGTGRCQVDGNIVYLTSLEVTHGGVAALQPIRLLVDQVEGDGWVISSFETTTPAAPPPGADTTDPASATAAAENDSTSPAAAVAVIRHYYEAINAGQFRQAYLLWGDSGRDSGQTFEEFVSGFAETASVQVEIGEPGRVEGAAGSRFIEIPVVIDAVLKDGRRQHFEGTYTLQRGVVEGATPAERRWHLYSAEIEER